MSALFDLIYAAKTGSIGWSEVTSHLSTHPHEAAGVRDSDGLSALHLAVIDTPLPFGTYHVSGGGGGGGGGLWFGGDDGGGDVRTVPADVVRELLRVDPSSATHRTSESTGSKTPLLLACENRLYVPHMLFPSGGNMVDLLNALLEAEPRAALMPDRSGDGGKGLFPLQIIWENYRTSYPQGGGGGGGNFGKRGGVWSNIRALLRACVSYLSSSSSSVPSDLHAAAACSWCCPLPVFRMALLREFGALRKKDKDGRLPIHISAASCPGLPPIFHPSPAPYPRDAIALVPLERRSDDDNDDDDNNNKDDDEGSTDLSILVRKFPESALLPDGCGRRPLFLAVASGRTWDEGIKTILEYHPSELTSKDGPSGLFPFQYAAANEISRANVDTVFRLLRDAPHLVAVADGDGDGDGGQGDDGVRC